MNHTLIIFVSVLAIFNLSLMSVYSWSKHKKSPAFLWLGFMFSSVAIAILNNITIFTNNENIWLYHLSIFLNISWGTYMIQFIHSISSTTGKIRLHKWQIAIALIYIPFLILMLFRPQTGREILDLAKSGQMNIFSIIFNFIIVVYSIGANLGLLFETYRSPKIKCESSLVIQTRKEILWLMFSLQLLAFLPFILQLDLIYIISYMPVFGQIFYIYIFFKLNKSGFPILLESQNTSAVNSSFTKYASLKITEQQSDSICCQISTHMRHKKPFIRAEYSLNDLAGELKIPANIISMIINSKMNKSFPDYINSLRIEEALQMLTGNSGNKLTIEAIAYDCGFNNRTSFYDAFKKHTGKLPSVYLSNKRGAGSLAESPL